MSNSTMPPVVAKPKFGTGSVAVAIIIIMLATLMVHVNHAILEAAERKLVAVPNPRLAPLEMVPSENSIEQDLISLSGRHKLIDCGTIASNHTHFIVKNPHHPDPTYAKAICETVIERSHPLINKLTIKLKRMELYRPNYDGSCMHDRFAVYTDLNVPITPVMCGNQTGKTVTVPFRPPLTSLIVSITTSDLDHDRAWVLEIEQENWP